MSIFNSYRFLGKYAQKPSEYLHPLEDVGQQLEDLPESRRFNGFIAASVIAFLAIIFQLFNLQLISGASNLNLAEGNRIRIRNIPAPRGIIYDKNKVGLVKNIARYDLVVVPADLPKNLQEQEKVFKKLQSLFNIDPENIKSLVRKNGLYSLEPVVLFENLPQSEALKYQVKLEDLSGVEVLAQPVRRYNSGFGLGHILGYIGKISKEELSSRSGYLPTDWIGRAGLEKEYEYLLKGVRGQEQVEIDAKGRLQRIISRSKPQQGNDIYLTLDLEVQKAAYEALKKAVGEQGNGRGVAISLNPKNGEIISLVSLPDFDPNIFILGDSKKIKEVLRDDSYPLLNRAIAGAYPPGSTVKPVMAAAALAEHIVSPGFKVDTPPEIRIGSSVFPDWKDHGVTDIRTAIAESNNIFFYALGGGWKNIKGLGIDKISAYLNRFKLSSKSGVDLPGEGVGFIPTKQWKLKKKGERWYIGDTYHLSIGQGDLTVTPIGLARAVSSIVNGGKLVVPHLVKSVKPVFREPQNPANLGVEDSNLKVVREGMRRTVESGSGRSLQGLIGDNGKEILAAGKTGTAQTGKGDKTHAWFIGYAPYDDPQILTLVLVEEGGEGYKAAIPVAKEIFKKYFR